MDGGVVSQVVTAALWLAAIIVALRIYVAAVRPLLKNWRLARRGFRPSNYRRQTRNFGLMKLIVTAIPTLVIVGVLAAIAIPAYQDYTIRAHDHKRLADLERIQLALSHYYSNHNAYPIADIQNIDAIGFTAALANLVSDGYILSIPNDPSGGDSTYYYRSTSSGSFYCLAAKMERNPPPSSCDATMLGGILFGANYSVGP